MSDSDDPFLRLTFDGGRFATHHVPVDVLSEFATLQDVVGSVARALFLHAHPKRKRVPKGFARKARLYMASSEPNCFTANLVRPKDPNVLIDPDAPILDRARQAVLDALDAAAMGRPVPADFPSEALELLSRFGEQLEGPEAIHVSASSTGRGSRVDRGTRSALARSLGRPLLIDEEFDGEVEAVEDSSGRYYLRTQGFGRVEVPLRPVHREDVMWALTNRPIFRVLVRGRAAQQKDDSWKVLEVDAFELVVDDRFDVVDELWTRIDTLGKLDDGWLSGVGGAPSAIVLNISRQVLQRILVECPELPRPKVYPTPEGGVQAEWRFPSWLVDACFSADAKTIVVEATPKNAGDDRSASIVIDSLVTASNELGKWLVALSS